MKKQISFKDANGNIFQIELEIESKERGRVFSASGTWGGGGGQCVGEIKPANDAQARLVAMWGEWHLNDMNAGTVAQSEAVKGCKTYDDSLARLVTLDKDGKPLKDAQLFAEMWGKFLKCSEGRENRDFFLLLGEYGQNEMVLLAGDKKESIKDKAEKFLFGSSLLFAGGYRYGSAWLFRELPEDFEAELLEVCEEIEEAEQERKTGAQAGDNDETRAQLVENGVEDADEQNKIIALAINEGLTLGELDEVTHERDNVFDYGGQEFKICTDEEADEEMIEECKQSAWAFNASFLSSFCDIPEEVFEALQPRCEGANDAIGSLIEKSGGWADFASEAASADGRGHFLNRNDGGEEEETVNGETFYIYKN